MLVLTAHAVEQFVSRCDRSLSFKDAEARLTNELPRANRLREKTAKGDSVWQLPSGPYLITKRDGTDDIVVTVLAQLHANHRKRRLMNDTTLPEDEEDNE